MVSSSSSQSFSQRTEMETEIYKIIEESFKPPTDTNPTDKRIAAVIPKVFEFVTAELELEFPKTKITELPPDKLKSAVKGIVEKAKIFYKDESWAGVGRKNRETLIEVIKTLTSQEGKPKEILLRVGGLEALKNKNLLSDKKLIQFVKQLLSDSPQTETLELKKMRHAADTLLAARAFIPSKSTKPIVGTDRTEKEKELARSTVEQKIDELNDELDKLLSLADRVIDEEAESYTSDQINGLLSMFDLASEKCHNIKLLATEHELTQEIFATFDIEKIIEGAKDKLHDLLPADQRKLSSGRSDSISSPLSSSRSSLTASTDSDIGSVSSDLSPRSAYRTEPEKELARFTVEQNIDELNDELNLLLNAADRVIDEAESSRKGTKDAKPYTSDQITGLLSLFDDISEKYDETRTLATTHNLSEFFSTSVFEKVVEEVKDKLRTLLPADQQAKAMQKPLSHQEQMAQIWKMVGSKGATAQKGIANAQALERKLKKAEEALKKAQEVTSTAENIENLEQLDKAQKLVSEIKEKLSTLRTDLADISEFTGPAVIELLENRISISQTQVESFEERVDAILFQQVPKSKNLVDQGHQLLNAHTKYTDKVMELLEKQNQTPNMNAQDLKALSEQYETLNKTFSKTLDEIEGRMDDILQHEETAKRTAEAKQKFAGQKTQAPTVIQAPTIMTFVTSTQKSGKTLGRLELAKPQPKYSRLPTTRAAAKAQALNPTAPMNIEEIKRMRKAGRDLLLQKLRNNPRTPVNPEELEAFKKAASDQAKALKDKARQNKG